ncbi:MAG: hypothetical protein PHX44_08170 [Sulfurimonas sp.]|uniref:hypothetical protein n=1 Tax=Sulfurimonas sp. TaxID=2022749 RepID=UPI0026178B67|nr:hypothetical protein [Sulfurimonas sp.]MDD2653009.1 hypothetical protein [Sulfurimonas sp.]MDD3452455.1 hypothetical protein [Sulfurimonas sp.]
MDLKEVQKVVNDLEYAIGKLEAFRDLSDLTDSLSSIEKNIKSLKKVSAKTIISNGIIGLAVGAVVGYGSVKIYESQNFQMKALKNFNLTIGENENAISLYVPIAAFSKYTNEAVIFTYDKKQTKKDKK